MKTIQFLFKELKREAPNSALQGRILAAVTAAEQEQILVYRRVSLAGITLSVGALLLGGFQYGTTLFESDFWTLMTLLFSDIDVIMYSLGDFGYSLLENLPLMPLLILFASLTLFFWSMSFLLSLPERGERLARSVFAH